MFNLLTVQKELKYYKNKLYKKKKFYIPNNKERKIIKNKIKENIDNKKEIIK